jgi:hypothetical protein
MKFADLLKKRRGVRVKAFAGKFHEKPVSMKEFVCIRHRRHFVHVIHEITIMKEKQVHIERASLYAFIVHPFGYLCLRKPFVSFSVLWERTAYSGNRLQLFVGPYGFPGIIGSSLN